MDLCNQWNALQDHELTVDNVHNILARIPDDLWVSVATLDRLVEDVAVQKALLTAGIDTSARLLENSRNSNSLASHFTEYPADAQICHVRRLLFERLDRLNTFVQISQTDSHSTGETETDDAWGEDPWDEPASSVNSSALSPVQFLTDDLLQLACSFALHQRFQALSIMVKRHGQRLWPFRFFILSCIPRHANPGEYLDILPSFDQSTNSESSPNFMPWRTDLDFSETNEVIVALEGAGLTIPSLLHDLNAVSTQLTANELCSWYQQYAESIITSTGMVDVAFTLVQHGAAQGLYSLDEFGEELSLFSRFVYETETPESVGGSMDIDKISLSQWRTMEPSAVVDLYLAHSTPETLPAAITRLVMPYLFVLEARAERSGHPDPPIPKSILYNHILSTNLYRVAAIFDASKPTLPASKRILKDDEDMARLALACLYGSNSLNEWPIMSSIFECLPAWEPQNNEGEDVLDMTITSLSTFVTPSTSGMQPTPSDLLAFFVPLPLSSLSHALDILDVHLESGEILSRWSVPVPLRWFLRSHSDVAEQRACANKMARRAGGVDDKLNTLEDWEWLLEDMLKLKGTGENGIRGAFGLLSEDEIFRIFFAGLLSTGMFEIAKNLLRHSKDLRLSASSIEELCLSCSQEFYDNASSGNYKVGDMKLAYDCLFVPAPSDRVQREKEFIEATSRLSSFNIMSKPGIPITPLEIRLTKDRLSLVSRVLSSNDDAYKHTEVILELVYKLGFRNNIVAEVKTLAMLADTALQSEDFQRAYDCSARMVDKVLNLKSSNPLGDDDQNLAEASEVCWVACFQLGKHPGFDDVEKQLSLFGRTLELCPPDRLHDVLHAWRQLEQVNITQREGKLSHSRSGYTDLSHPKRDGAHVASFTGASLKARLQEFRMPSPSLLNSPDAAALATKTLKSVAANFPFSVGSKGESPREVNELGTNRRPGSGDMSAQASRAFSRGIGWLIGAEED